MDFVRHCQDRYFDLGVEPTEEAHSPLPKCMGGTETVLLTRQDHAKHDVLQTECYQKGCFSGWYLNLLVGTDWEERAKAALKVTTTYAGKQTNTGKSAVERQLGIHDPKHSGLRKKWGQINGKLPASSLQKQTASKTAKGRRYINNGKFRCALKPGQELPPNWEFGRGPKISCITWCPPDEHPYVS